MRLISLKIWRAFPELDQYDDAVCRLYIRHARRFNNTWKGALLVLLSLGLAVLVWIGVIYFGIDRVEEYTSSARGGELTFGLFLMSLLLTGIIWFPLLVAFFVRDRWLRRCVMAQLRSTNCAGCGYQLVGLTIIEDQGCKHVVCPECGVSTALNTGHITESDINPELLNTA